MIKHLQQPRKLHLKRNYIFWKLFEYCTKIVFPPIECSMATKTIKHIIMTVLHDKAYMYMVPFYVYIFPTRLVFVTQILIGCHYY